MSIPALEIKRAMEAQLGTFGTQRYLDIPHYLPAIRAAQRRLNGLVEGVFAENKGGEEIFIEITETKVFQTDQAATVRFLESELGHKMWSIAAIYPEPETEPAPVPAILPAGSYLRQDLDFVGSGQYFTRRITVEQAGPTRNNRFLPGNEVTASGPRRSYAYYLTNDRAKIIPQSISANRVVGVTYLRTIEPVQSMADSIPYPDRAFQLIVDLALNEIAGRQGSTALLDRTAQQVRTLLLTQA